MLLLAHLIHRLAQVLGDMKLVESDLLPRLRDVRLAGADIGRPHAHRHRLDVGLLLVAQLGVVSRQALRLAVIRHMQHGAVFLVGHHGHVLVPSGEGDLVHAQVFGRLGLAPGQAALDRPLHHSDR